MKAVSTTKSFLKAFKKQWGDRSINEIDRATVSAYAKKLLDNGRAIGTVRRQLGLLRFIYAWTAQQLNIELENPAEKVLKFLSPEVRRKLRNETNQRILQYFTEDEFRRMVEVCNDDERRVILWAYLSLMRKSEILNARWEDIDQDRKVLRIPFTKTEIPREIPFRGELHNILDELGWKDAGPIFKRVWLFRPEGFYRLLKKAGIEKAPQKGFHRLRHSGATHLLKIGVNPLVVQKIGGWTDPKILFQTYAHLGQNIGDKAAAIEALGNYSLQILYRSSEEPITQPTEITSPFPS
ncbi:MAG: tyrosine-type recombinase/integrase [Syntrophobacterales bacterium]|nr:MAG: tyrosine-type recombinase/integrase [Syntrophobacterales bacterium]